MITKFQSVTKTIFLLSVIVLTACGGGGTPTPTITGSVNGLATGSQIVLSDNTVATSNGTIYLYTSTPSITEQPYNQTCSVTGTVITCADLAVPYHSNGFVVPMWSYSNHSDTLASLTTLKNNTKANTIIVDFHLATNDLSSNDVYIQNPSLIAGLKDVLQTAKSLGLDVWFKPIVMVGGNGTNWQYLTPTDPQQWFTNYGNALNSLANIIDPYHVSHFLITNELTSMTTNPEYSGYWRTLITNLRSNFRGELGFNAGGLLGGCDQCDEFTNIPTNTLSYTDFIGISAYPRLLGDRSYTPTDISAAWSNNQYSQNLVSLVNTFVDNNPTLPIFFSELGSPALFGGNANPTQSPDPRSQAAFYAGSLPTVTNNMRKVDGVFVYNWVLRPNNSQPVNINSIATWDIYNKPDTHSIFLSHWTTLRTQQ